VSWEEVKIAVDSKYRASIRNDSYTIPSQSISPIVTCLARGDFAGPGYGNCQAKSRAYSENVEARQELAYDVLHSLESIRVGHKLTTSKRKSTRLYQWPTNWLPLKNSLQFSRSG
jgi:hypothetical protein